MTKHPVQLPSAAPTVPGTPRSAGRWPRTIAIIGAAGVIGAATARELAISGLVERILLFDLQLGAVEAQAIDIREMQVFAGASTASVAAHPIADAGAAAPVDLVILAASAPESPNGSRLDFLAKNLALIRTLTPSIEVLAGEDGTVLILSNPIDVLADVFSRISVVEAHRILGYSLNDSLRLRIAVAREVGAAAQDVDALILGEHGSGQVPLFSQVHVNGEKVELDPEARCRIVADIDGWFARWSALNPGRSTGWTTSYGVVQMIRALADGSTVPAAAWTGPVNRLNDTFVAMPVRRIDGRLQLAKVDATQEEWSQLESAAKSVHAHAQSSIGVPHA